MLALFCGTFPYKFIIQSLNKYLSSTGMVGNVLALRMQSWRRHNTYSHGAYISIKTDKQKANIYVHDSAHLRVPSATEKGNGGRSGSLDTPQFPVIFMPH